VALAAARPADADQGALLQTEGQRTGMQQYVLENVLVTAQIHPSHPLDFVQMKWANGRSSSSPR
jgi:hypothetical protein